MTPRKWYKKKRFLLPLIVVFAFVSFVGFVACQIWAEMNAPTHYEHGSDYPNDKLPPSAHDVRLTRMAPFGPNSMLDFACTESDFRIWVEATRPKHPELGEIRASDNGLYPFIDANGELVDRITGKYLVSDWRFEDQGLHLVYDLSTGRALRWSHSR